MQQAGNTPPINIKNKDKWINAERERWTKLFNIPTSGSMPDPFPQSTVAAQRALCYVQSAHPEKLVAAIDVLYAAFWVENKAISKPETVVEALGKVFGGEEAKKIVEQGAKSDEAKEGLKKNTQLAWKDGAFGLPWFVATNEKGDTEGFWGVDHLGQMMDFLEVKRVQEGGWRAML
jgi:2-hydroxychromene-2-carboxylate isomerase